MGNVHSHHKPTPKKEAWITIAVGCLAFVCCWLPAFFVFGMIGNALAYLEEKKPVTLELLAVLIPIAVGFWMLLALIRMGIQEISEGIQKLRKIKRDMANDRI